MNISEIFIRRPVMTILLMMAMLLFGLLGYQALPISDLPNVDFPTIVVSASLPGASPETMANSIATPLEKEFSTIAGIDSMNSSSSLGQTRITLQFSLNRDIDSAAQDVQTAISQALRRLPSGMPTPPSFRKVNPAASPILYISLSSLTVPLYTVNQYAETILAKQISMVDGVAEVSIYGAKKYAIRVQVNPDILAAYQIGLDELANVIRQSNVNLPTGSMEGKRQSYLIQTAGQLLTPEDYRPLIVSYRNGAPVRLNALAKIEGSVENSFVGSWYNNSQAIILAIQRQPGTNTIEVVNRIKRILPNFEKQLPASIKLNILLDRSESIRASIREVQYTLLIAAVLVIIVIFLFLRNFIATLIPGVALPLSIIATFGMMHQFNFSLNNLSLLGLTLVVGYVVDDAIVMLENIFRHREKGDPPLKAALNGSKEISFTIISMTLSLVVVFIPVLFMGGLLGRLLHEFGVTIVIAILFSGFISLTLTPMMCSKILKKSAMQEPKWVALTYFGDVLFPALQRKYEKSLQWTLKHQLFTLIVFFITVFLSFFLFIIIPKGFIPSEDTGQIFGFTEADSSVSFAEMSERQKKIANIAQQDPNVQHVMSSVGVGGASVSQNSGRLFIKLKPRDQRNLSAEEVIQELRRKIADIPGIKIYLQSVASISMGPLSKSTYQYTLQSSDMKELIRWAGIYLNEITNIPGTQDVTTDLQYTGPQVFIDINRNKASALGVSAEAIQTTLQSAYGGFQISTIYTPIEDYKVILELESEASLSPSMLSRLYVRASNGKLIPLSTFVTIKQSTGPLTINHQGQLASVTIAFNLKSDASLGNVVDAIEQLKIKLQPPATLVANFQGTAQAFQSSLEGLSLLLLFSILVMYIILGILYESFIHPLTILSGLPAAGVGALLTLLLFGMDLNFYSFVGIIMLIGIVKKNAIMMIDFAIEAQRNQEKMPKEAIYQACLIRFRPIMMTTMAALMGAIPIAFAFGEGSEARRPLGVAVLGGLLVSQLLTLYLTPVIYLYFEALKNYISREKNSGHRERS